MNRDQVVEYVANLSNLKESNLNLYYLSDTHDLDPDENDVFLISPHQLEVFEVICAYIQFQFDEVEHGYSPPQAQIKNVLTKFYDCMDDDASSAFAVVDQIDLYENWEIYCGAFGEIEEIELLYKEGMTDYISELIHQPF